MDMIKEETIMANNNSLRSVIESNKDCVRFAKHFQKNSSIKNMLRSFDNAKTITVAFDEKYATEIIGYGKVRESLEVVLIDVFKEYIKKYTNDKLHGNTQGLPDRVEFLIGLIDERMKRDPGTSIVRDLGDYSKTKTGKELERIVKSVGGDNDELMDLLLMVAVRCTINDVMSDDTESIVEVDTEETDDSISNESIHSDNEPIDVDFVIVEDEPKSEDVGREPEHRAHTSSKPKHDMSPKTVYDLIVSGKPKENITPDDILQSMTKMTDNEMRDTIRAMFTYCSTSDINKFINNIDVSGVDEDRVDDLMSMLPVRTRDGVFNGIDIRKVARIVANDSISSNNSTDYDSSCIEIVTQLYLFINAVECVVNINNEDHFVKYAFNIIKIISDAYNGKKADVIRKLHETSSMVDKLSDEIRDTNPVKMSNLSSFVISFNKTMGGKLVVKEALYHFEKIA